MRIGIISDTHGSPTAFRKALGVLGRCNFILHAGDVLYHGPRNPLPEGYNPKELAEIINGIDIPLLIAAGNCDAPIDQMLISVPIQSPYTMLCFDNHRLLLTHGHDLSEENLEELAARWKIDILVTGHTHVKGIKKLPGLTHINPGSCSLPKDGIPSVGLIDGSRVLLINLDTGQALQEEELN
ncbi:phosphodiesterase [Thermosediminibacter oceani]|uniref:Phosphoesterase n=1 Tax=Thermosediminibacter oceani (strain ATCC BAA-1034 / DSM 16646 / JW/IW-1228P) TaxID=555079 RepID=D9RY21_THEOJ|nr:phosphodiesterase [Thermosediminibacter oceani]ADL08245.1 phosphodiesterase, MJ0936 family [Thermosediminibacter oceani DSM 16646]